MNGEMQGSQEPGTGEASKRFTVYAAGEMFNLHDLASNVYLKEAVWELSNGKYELLLPQSKELRELDHPDLAAYIRNQDLKNVLQADLVLARFDGIELDSGTVVEYMVAKFLGKPAVILRTDSRQSSADRLDEPYNLMAKNWPRTVQVHAESLLMYMRALADGDAGAEHQQNAGSALQAELDAVRKGLEAIARQVIEGLEAAVSLPSPYPPEYRERVYSMARFSAGSGFDELITEEVLAQIIERLRDNGTL